MHTSKTTYALPLMAAFAAGCAAAPVQVLWRDPAADGGIADAGEGTVSGPLRAEVQVLQGELTCGACSWLSTRVTGGQPPYSYEWSDAMLAGPGPHRVCPSVPTSYSLRVSDAHAPRASALAEAAVPCVRDSQPQDAGTDVGGCAGTQLVELPAVCGSNPLGLATSISNTLSQVLRAGRRYRISFQMSEDTLQLSRGLDVDIFLGAESCKPEQWVANVKLDGEPVQPSTCVTPERDFGYLIGVARPTSSMITAGGPIHTLPRSTSRTLCFRRSRACRSAYP